MGKPLRSVELSETLSLSEYTKRDGNSEFWLYDKTRGMNLSVRAKSEVAAFVEALRYYQERLNKVEQEFTTLKLKVDAFVSQFMEDEDA